MIPEFVQDIDSIQREIASNRCKHNPHGIAPATAGMYPCKGMSTMVAISKIAQ